MAGRLLFDALAARYGGGAYAAVQLSRSLAVHPNVSEMLVVARAGSIVERGLAGAPGVRCVVLPAAARAELVRRIGWQATRLLGLAREERCDAVLTMAGLPVQPRGLATLCYFCNPVMYEVDTPANRLRRWAGRRTARRADFVAAPSRLMAELVEESVGGTCHVVPLAVDRSVFSPAAAPGSEVLCVGDFYAHKRHDVLLAAWSSLPSPRPRLRLIGNPSVDPENYLRVHALVSQAPESESIALDGRVSLDSLVRAYRDARVFVMPSERESFCMPLAEAMACGVPAVARDIGSLRETGGDGARYVRGDDARDWAREIERLLGDDAVFTRSRDLALAAAGRFSWEASAAAFADWL
jgi:glycosyltransferase involved in cell wall biosynthesis